MKMANITHLYFGKEALSFINEAIKVLYKFEYKAPIN